MKYSKDLLKDIIGWDVRNWSVVLAAWDKALQSIQPPALALELGAREGGLSLYLALKGFQIICSDLENPELLARPKHRMHKVDHKIQYVSADAQNLPFENAHFDVVIYKSMLGTIGRNNRPDLQQATIGEINRVLKPGGVLLFAENLAGTGLHRFFRKMTRWGGYWRYVTIDEMQQFHRDYSSFSYNTYGLTGTFGRTESQRGALHYVDRLVDPILKDHHKYIIFGHARK